MFQADHASTKTSAITKDRDGRSVPCPAGKLRRNCKIFYKELPNLDAA